jgi:hypothetical protein
MEIDIDIDSDQESIVSDTEFIPTVDENDLEDDYDIGDELFTDNKYLFLGGSQSYGEWSTVPPRAYNNPHVFEPQKVNYPDWNEILWFFSFFSHAIIEK